MSHNAGPEMHVVACVIRAREVGAVIHRKWAAEVP
jgi:hypothetical protein